MCYQILSIVVSFIEISDYCYMLLIIQRYRSNSSCFMVPFTVFKAFSHLAQYPTYLYSSPVIGIKLIVVDGIWKCLH